MYKHYSATFRQIGLKIKLEILLKIAGIALKIAGEKRILV
jgi:hypothetical protein